jgi:charged multivesicular body protein 4
MGVKSSKGAKQESAKQTAQPQPARPQPEPQRTSHEAGGKVTSTDQAVLNLKLQRDDLNKAARRATKLSKKLNEEAKKYLQSDPPQRDKALRCVKRRKLYEARVKQISGMQDNVESMLNAVESAQFESQVLATLKQGGEALRTLTRDMGDVEKTMDDVADAVAEARAISELLGESVGVDASIIDEDVLEAELAQLMAGESATSATVRPKTDTTTDLPKVPTHVLPSTSTTGKVPAEDEKVEVEDEEPRVRQAVAA